MSVTAGKHPHADKLARTPTLLCGTVLGRLFQLDGLRRGRRSIRTTAATVGGPRRLVINLGQNILERKLDVGGVQRRSLDERQCVLLSILLRRLSRNLPPREYSQRFNTNKTRAVCTSRR